MNFELSADLVDYLARMDAFIADEIKPLEEQDDNIRFFDHRREWARTDFERDGLPRPEWAVCWPKRDTAPTALASCGSHCRASSVDRTAPISGWQSSASISPQRA